MTTESVPLYVRHLFLPQNQILLVHYLHRLATRIYLNLRRKYSMEYTWFICHRAPESAIRLGQLITDPRKPTMSLAKPLPTDPLILRSENTVLRLGAGRNAGLGFSAKVLSWLPFSIKGEGQRNSKHHYEIKKVEERTIYPEYEYVQKSVFQESVLKNLAGYWVGSEARIIDERKSETGGSVSGTVPGSAVGVPVDLGGEVSGRATSDYYQEQDYKDPFVFAYRLREIRYFTKDNSIRQSDYTQGADLHGLQEPIYIPGKVGEKYFGIPEEIDVEGIAGEDFKEDAKDAKIVDGCVMLGKGE